MATSNPIKTSSSSCNRTKKMINSTNVASRTFIVINKISSHIVLSDYCIHVQICNNSNNDYNNNHSLQSTRSLISIIDETLMKVKNCITNNNNNIPFHHDDNNNNNNDDNDNDNNNVINTSDENCTINNDDKMNIMSNAIITMPKIISNDEDIKALELIQLGSIMFLSKKDNENNDEMNQDNIIIEWKKPIRLLEPNFICHNGDYLRIHYQPRRFQHVYQYNWNGYYNYSIDNKEQQTKHHDNDIDHQHNDDNNNLPGVIISRDDEKGYVVINKPSMIPVHNTVDNSYENIASCLLHVEKLRKNNGNKHQSIESSSSVLSNDNNNVTILTPQRLDQNTSGLLVLATSKLFADYFANLLRTKTKNHLSQPITTTDDNDDRINHDDDYIKSNATNTNHMNHNHIEEQKIIKKNGHINKLYRCLICLMITTQEEPRLSIDDDDANQINDDDQWNAIEKMGNEIYEYVNTGKIMKHYLAPSIRGPKSFVKDIPNTSLSSWPICLLRITKASPIYPVVGDTVASVELAQELWTTTQQRQRQQQQRDDILDDEHVDQHVHDCSNYEYNKPKNCYGVMEIEIELLTGRTHQIRGQLSAFGYPIVGDVSYGGAVEVWNNEKHMNYYKYTEERLALQCCQLEFYDPDIIKTKHIKKDKKTNANSTLGYDNIEETYTKISMNVSTRLNTFHLHDAWWTPSIQKYIKKINGNENNQQQKHQ